MMIPSSFQFFFIFRTDATHSLGSVFGLHLFDCHGAQEVVPACPPLTTSDDLEKPRMPVENHVQSLKTAERVFVGKKLDFLFHRAIQR